MAEKKKTKDNGFQSAYNNLMVTPDKKYNAAEAKFYLQRIHEETSFSFQKILADAVIAMVTKDKRYSSIRTEWKKGLAEE